MRAISLFAGAGGDTLGMKMCGVDVVAYSEVNKDAIQTHDANNKKCDFLGDVTLINEHRLAPYINNIDILFAGFPCQGFSNAGKKLPNDPRNDLFTHVVRIANIIRPKVIIGENVAGILTRVNADGIKFSSVIVEKFNAIGFNVEHKVYDTSFCIPQSRKRVIFVCSQNPNITPPVADTTTIGIRNFLESVSSGGVLYSEIDIKDDKIIKSTENNGEKPHSMLVKLTNEKNITYGKRTPVSGEIIDIDKPTKTITCSYAFCPRLFVPVQEQDKKYLRMFTIRELARAQGFPDYYEFTGSKSSQIKQIGNAVPPLFAKFIVSEILKQI
ncbi:cytosine-specific methyltransferase [Paramecium bursaria Chlorella virus CVM-1]|nr:cytosine-specific methyltransferase [Paramecium bursaria Chlorella virus AP110A]AGE51950.1 cytosine-specific methyltransferase [Paramecium bursaria Chlorella virus CVM-1]